MPIFSKSQSYAYKTLGDVLGTYFSIPVEQYQSIAPEESLLHNKYGLRPYDLVFVLLKMEEALCVHVPNEYFEETGFYTLQNMVDAFAQQLT